jgi:hypothetical protein
MRCPFFVHVIARLDTVDLVSLASLGLLIERLSFNERFPKVPQIAALDSYDAGAEVEHEQVAGLRWTRRGSFEVHSEQVGGGEPALAAMFIN